MLRFNVVFKMFASDSIYRKNYIAEEMDARTETKLFW